MLSLKLERPLVVFDIESTGLSPRKDRIVELAAIKVMPDGTEICKCWLMNPEVKIPPETTAIHGISNELVKDCPTFPPSVLTISIPQVRAQDMPGESPRQRLTVFVPL